MFTSALRHVTLIGPNRTILAIFVREIHRGNFRMEHPKDYSNNPEHLEKLRDRVVKYCNNTGLDKLGAYKVVASGPEHQSGGYPVNHLTCKVYDGLDRQIILKGRNGRKWDRIHIEEDENMWVGRDYYSVDSVISDSHPIEIID